MIIDVNTEVLTTGLVIPSGIYVGHVTIGNIPGSIFSYVVL